MKKYVAGVLATFGAVALASAAHAVALKPAMQAGNAALELVQAKPAAEKATAKKKPAARKTATKAKKKTVAKKAPAKKTVTSKRRRVSRSFASLTCSVEANKKGLKGAARKSYRNKCLRAAAACSTSARSKKLKGQARAAFRKQCVTIAAHKLAN